MISGSPSKLDALNWLCLFTYPNVQVGEDLKAKVVQAAAAKVKKLSKKEGKVGVKEVEKDEFDKMAEDKQNLRQRINSGQKETKVKQHSGPLGGG